MRNRILLKSLFAVVWLGLVSGCVTTSEKKAGLTEPHQTTATQIESKEPSSWQQAYGEKQAKQENTLDPLPQVKPQLPVDQPVTDLWTRIRNGFQITDHQQLHKQTEQQLKWFAEHPDYIDRVVERAQPYLHYIVTQIEARDMPLEIALLPVVESGFKPYAYSHGRAAGLWQFIPGTGKLYGLKQNWWYDGRRDVIESTRAALDYLQKLHNDFGDWQLALAAYNCGEGTVSRAIKRNEKEGKPTDFWSLNLPRETSAYVPKLMAISHLVKFPEKYNINLNPIDNKPYLAVVDIESQIDLALAAKLAEISADEMYMLNPGFNHWATDPQGPHQLAIPLDNADSFKQKLAQLPQSDRIQWARHKIKSGESLGVIAEHYKTSISVIKKANKLSSNSIRAGNYLLIPAASGNHTDYALTEAQRLAALTSNPSTATKKVTHTVRSGDTWWEIAKQHGVHVNTLTKWNGKAPGDVLRPGQKLVIWKEQLSGKGSDKVKTVYYTIKDGDSLWSIARKFNVSVVEVRTWNDLSERTLIQPGQNLTLYVDVTQQANQI